VTDFDHQDETFSRAFNILHKAIENHAFPAASIAVTHAGKLIALNSFGKFVFEESRELGDSHIPKARVKTPFDLASLTKPIATTTMAMLLHEKGILELDAEVAAIIPEFRSADARRNEITFRMLLAHSSGLPAYEKLFLTAHSRQELLEAALSAPLTADPGTRMEYSDIGFIILATALERLAEDTLDAFCRRNIFRPLTMGNTMFNPPASKRSRIAPTADEREIQVGREKLAADLPTASPRSTLRNRIIQGEVQDENAFILGGVAGHAGLFSTAEDVARFAHAMLQGGSPLLSDQSIKLFTRREPAPDQTSRALGWDTPSTPSQSGKYFGPNSYGHLGYTGTSLWIDPDRQLSITLLTNRTWPDCATQAIKQVRPAFHDAVIEALSR
jgi:CubicO group peptidase (beta-lactamase class C family)